MMEPKGTGAASHEKDGKKKRQRTPEEIVSRLQARIVKAQEAGRYNKVKALQYLLTPRKLSGPVFWRLSA